MTQKPPAPPPRFSVVIPLYNKAETIERAVRSVLSQSLAELELIVVDDGSEDHGAESLLAIRDPRLTVLSQPNRGVSVARNVGVDAATASYVCFLDADDAWSPRFLEHIDRLITACPDAAMFCARYSFVTREGDISLGTIDLALDHVGTVDDFFRTYRKSRSFINSSNVCIRKDVFDVVGKFPEGEPIGEDVYMWLRIAEVYEVAYDATILVTIFHDAPNRTDQRLRMRVPFHLKYYLGSDRHKPIREDLMRFPGLALPDIRRRWSAAGRPPDRQEPRESLVAAQQVFCATVPCHCVVPSLSRTLAAVNAAAPQSRERAQRTCPLPRRSVMPRVWLAIVSESSWRTGVLRGVAQCGSAVVYWRGL